MISIKPLALGIRLRNIVSIAARVASALPSLLLCHASGAPTVTGDARVDQLLSQMTLAEKLSLIEGATEDPSTNQGEAGYITGVPRLGIPSLRLADGPPGVLTRVASQAETATMGLAATFSRQDAVENGVVVGREAKSLGVDVVLEPFINMARDTANGRGSNTYGEDPLLTGAIGAGLVEGIQSIGVMAQAKHYIGYDGGGNAVIDPQSLHEIYLAPFKDAVDAGVASIMCSHNMINGAQSCGNPDTLDGLLKGELGFKGFVTTDWGAMHDPNAIFGGVDMEMPGQTSKNFPMTALMPPYFSLNPPHAAPPLTPAQTAAAIGGMLSGDIPEEPANQMAAGMTIPGGPQVDLGNLRRADPAAVDAAVTRAAGRVLYEIDRFGYLDHPPTHQLQPHATEANAKIIEKTAEDAAVLLKNDGHILPLKSSDLADLAMIGPGAGQTVAIGMAGERSVGLPSRQIGPYQALLKAAPDARVRYAVADDMTGSPIPAANLNVTRADGTTDAQIDFTNGNGKTLPADTAVTWNGTLTVPSAGSYWIYLQVLGAGGSVSIDGRQIERTGSQVGALHGDTVLAGKDGLLPTTDGLDDVRAAAELSAGTHRITVSVAGDVSHNPEQVRLNWYTPAQRQADHDAAIAAARAAKTAVVFAWTRGNPNYALPGDQDQLIEEIAAVNPNTIVVLNTSQPMALPWLSKVKGLVEMWWPGDEGGWATANILLGKADPAGRLPFTWAEQPADYPAGDPAHPERSAMGVDGVTNFSEGIYIGYRWFDRQQIKPLFPFGYGLSYTQFSYSDLQAAPANDGGLDVSFKLSNTGPVAGDDVPQIYLGAPEQAPAGAQFAMHALAGFDRVHLGAGETRTVSLHLPARRLEYWSSAASAWKRATGSRTVFLGGSSRDLPVQTTVTVP